MTDTKDTQKEHELISNQENTPKKEEYSSKNRLALIDNFRGIIIFLTVVTWYIGYFPFMPWWFPHSYSRYNGIGFADLGVVAFSFILSVMMSYNFRRRADKDGFGSAAKHFVNRALILIAIGFTVNYVKSLFYNVGRSQERVFTTWNIIVTYGICTLLMLMFLPIKKSEVRLAIGFGILLLYQLVFLHIKALLPWIRANDQGGVLGAISFLGLMLIVSAMGDFYFKEKKKFYIYSSGIIGFGLILILLNLFIKGNPQSWDFFSFIYMDKMYQTFGYMVGSLAVTLVLFIGCDLIPAFRNKRIPLFNRMGQNSIVFYALGGILLGVAITVGKPIQSGVMTGATGVDMLIGLCIMVIPMLIAAFVFEKTKFKISL